MNFVGMGIQALFNLLVIALCAYLLIRGITHLFVGLFAAGALLHLLQTMGFAVFSRMPGGIGAYSTLFPLLMILAALGTFLFAAGFISLTLFLLRPSAQTA
ncbi:MAG: hypothetical protein ACJ8HU_05720 [Chthoniobacterales bacterium]